MNPKYENEQDFKAAQARGEISPVLTWEAYQEQGKFTNLFGFEPKKQDIFTQQKTITVTDDKGNQYQIAQPNTGATDKDGNYLKNTSTPNQVWTPTTGYTTKEQFNTTYNDLANNQSGELEEEDTTDTEKKQPTFMEYLTQVPNLGMGISTEDKFKIFGNTLSYKADFLNNDGLEKKAKRANTITGVAAGTAGFLDIFKNIYQGMGVQKRQNQWNENYWKDQRDLQKQEYKPTMKDGGEIPLFRYGGTFLDIPYEKMAINEYVGGLPAAMEDLANAEIEDEEYIIDPDNVVKKAMGLTHEKGGIKTILQPGTKVVSDNLKVGAKLAKEINSQLDLGVRLNHTYAEVIDKYNAKIGLAEKNAELEKLYKQLKKNDEIENESTKRVNETFLMKEIKEEEQERQRLLEARAVFANKVYNKQQEGKLEKFENGGMFKGGNFEALCKKYKLTKEQGLEMLKQYEDGGQEQVVTQEQPQMGEQEVNQLLQMYAQMVNIPQEQLVEQFLGMTEEQIQGEVERMASELQQAQLMKNGGKVKQYADGNPPTIQEILNQYQTKPSYNYSEESLPQMKERLKMAADEWGLDEVVIQQIDKAKNINDLNSLAGKMQDKVDPAIAKDFGLKIAPTKTGLEYIKTKPKAELVKIYGDNLANKIINSKAGSFKGFTDSEVETITNKTQEAFKTDEKYATTNFKDKEWFFRYPTVKPAEFNSKQEYDNYLNAERAAGRTIKNSKGEELVVAPNDKSGLYIKPTYKESSTSTTNTSTTATTTENQKIEQEYKTKFEDLQKMIQTSGNSNQGMLFVPNTPNLPPDGIYPHVKREYRTELVDPMAISPEAVLRENYRTQASANESVEDMPIGMRGAANANLTAITQENNAKAILETERFNAQNKQQVEQMNVQLNNQDEMMRYNEIPRYEALQLTAMEKTKNDLYNYFNAGIQNQANKYSYINSYNMTKSMFPDITTDIFGVPTVKKDNKPQFS